jgi:hypothetical protein
MRHREIITIFSFIIIPKVADPTAPRLVSNFYLYIPKGVNPTGFNIYIFIYPKVADPTAVTRKLCHVLCGLGRAQLCY